MTIASRKYQRTNFATTASNTLQGSYGGSATNNDTNNGPTGSGGTGEDDADSLYAPFPKHVPYPNVDHSSELLHEFVIFFSTIIATMTQFMHLYRTVWWLPNSYNRKSMNFYLIDSDLAIFIDIMVSRRLMYCLILKFIDANCPELYVGISKKVAKYTFLTFLVISSVFYGTQIYQKTSYFHLLVLCYPLVLYLVIFGVNLEQFLRTIVDTEPNCINGMPLHSCSSNAASIRTEIEALKADLNNRFKQAIFTSLLNAYYAGLVPCVLASKHLYYNKFWTTQHLVCVFIGGFTMCITYCFPMRYCDVFHRAALHLGQWNRVNSRATSFATVTWSKTGIFPYGTYVRHLGEVYRAVGSCTSAIPANNSHYRFYAIFRNPIIIYLVLFVVQMFMIVVQLAMLVMSREWQNGLSIGFVLLTNLFTLFRIARDYFIARRVYASEMISHSKLKAH
ncbi:transmembrane protein 39A-B [Anopheles ziemanni]|uniref:transmembrane protein 39A-B n=1 Tax=Anopheles coustani TaxID=139045 RepID=UPI00265919DA|nr:transmembrane protein 39A-B [Anopheles coustani]XP_058171508.1 transmembrane protein 39A-B [Anopheles ziemanni]